MRYNRVIAAVAVLMALGACTNDKASPDFNPTPKPTRPGQVVVIAGNPAINRDPRDGQYALQSSAYGGGGLAVSVDGTIFYRVYYSREGRIVRLGKDGRVALNVVNIVPDQMFIRGNDLWLVGANSGLAVTRVSISDWKQERIIQWDARTRLKGVEVVDHSGMPFSVDELKRLYADWKGAKMVIRADGTPVVVARSGRLFEILGPQRLREWIPAGYAQALGKVADDKQFDPEDAVLDDEGDLILLGAKGIVHIPRAEVARQVRFPESVAKLPPWTAVTPLGQGSVLLLGGTTATQNTPRPTIVRPDGRLELLSWGSFRWCAGSDGTLAAVASALPGGVVRRNDGTLLLNDKRCGQVYAFRLPDRLVGTPYGK